MYYYIQLVVPVYLGGAVLKKYSKKYLEATLRAGP